MATALDEEGVIVPFLEGIRVVDASQYLPGQYATMLLADLGAEVIRLERPGEGDPSRRDWPGAFYTSNRNKKSLAVNLKAPEGQAVLHRLIRTADVFLEGYRPGVAARLGADDGTLRGLNPALVYVSITGYGQSGPYRDVTGHDINYIAMAGLLDIPGDLEQPPVMPGVPVADYAAALFAALCILAALRRRDRTGQGEYVDLAMVDPIIAWGACRYGEMLWGDPPPVPEQMPHLSPANRVYEAGDGRKLAVGALEDKFFAGLCRAVGHAEWAEDPRFATNAGRIRHADTLIPMLKEVFAQKPRDEWLALLQRAGVPCAPVLSYPEVLSDPIVTERGLLLPDPRDPGRRHIAFPARFASGPLPVYAPVPSIGEHTAQLLAELGYTEADVTELARRGVVQVGEGGGRL